MTFDAVPAAQLEPVRKKLSRLKRAHVPSEAVTAAQPHSPALAAFDAAPRALSDRTNLDPCPEQASHLSPPMSPTTTAPEPSASPPNSPAQSLLGSANSPKVSEKLAAEVDYWDSEDELEAELTRRERAEGFHAESQVKPKFAAGQHATLLFECSCLSLLFLVLLICDLDTMVVLKGRPQAALYNCRRQSPSRWWRQ